MSMNGVLSVPITRRRRRSVIQHVGCSFKGEAKVLVIYTGGTIGMLDNPDGVRMSMGKVVNISPMEHRCNIVKTLSCDFNQKSSVLVIYSGGSFGMLGTSDGALAPAPNYLGRFIRRCPFLHDEEYAEKHFKKKLSDAGPFVLPEIKNKKRVIYSLLEYDPLLDSSNMTVDDWIYMAEDIKKWYESFDGFVILHGTDTLAYTASALSFMLENLGKTVVMTGAQLSLFEPRSDAKDNLLDSLILAGNYVIPDVSICFGRKLFRGNRTTKMDAEGFNAFDSPSCTPLAILEVEIEVNYREIFRPTNIERMQLHGELNRNVGLLRLFPSITVQTVRAFLQPPIQGVVLQTYGSGNMPSNRQDLIDEIKSAIDREVIVLNCLQCIRGTVTDAYETGKVLSDMGVISGADMTPEAALTKLSYVLSKTELTYGEKRKMLESNLRGELTLLEPTHTEIYDSKLALQSLEKSLELDPTSASKVLFPALMCSAASKDDPRKINNLISCGAEVSQPNTDQRTPLHVACCEGNLEMVKHLLHKGASVHAKDRFNHTPLNDAIRFDHHDIIQLLVSCGAHLTLPEKSLGEKICKAARRGDIAKIMSFKYSGANLSEADYSGRTAIHEATLHENIDFINFLMKQGNLKKDTPDLLGLTPVDYATRLNKAEILSLLENVSSQ